MNAPLELAALKARQQTFRASGDYAGIGITVQPVGDPLAEACDLLWGERVLDVAEGNGNASLASTCRGAAVTSTDCVEGLLNRVCPDSLAMPSACLEVILTRR